MATKANKVVSYYSIDMAEVLKRKREATGNFKPLFTKRYDNTSGVYQYKYGPNIPVSDDAVLKTLYMPIATNLRVYYYDDKVTVRAGIHNAFCPKDKYGVKIKEKAFRAHYWKPVYSLHLTKDRKRIYMKQEMNGFIVRACKFRTMPWFDGGTMFNASFQLGIAHISHQGIDSHSMLRDIFYWAVNALDVDIPKDMVSAYEINSFKAFANLRAYASCPLTRPYFDSRESQFKVVTDIDSLRKMKNEKELFEALGPHNKKRARKITMRLLKEGHFATVQRMINVASFVDYGTFCDFYDTLQNPSSVGDSLISPIRQDPEAIAPVFHSFKDLNLPIRLLMDPLASVVIHGRDSARMLTQLRVLNPRYKTPQAKTLSELHNRLIADSNKIRDAELEGMEIYNPIGDRFNVEFSSLDRTHFKLSTFRKMGELMATGRNMRHCVGNRHYGIHNLNGTSILIKVERDNKEWATIELNRNYSDDGYRCNQFYGFGNAMHPYKEMKEVLRFLELNNVGHNFVKPEVPRDDYYYQEEALPY